MDLKTFHKQFPSKHDDVKLVHRSDQTQPSRTARCALGMNRCTVSETPVRSDLEYTYRFTCLDKLGASDQIVQISTLTLPSAQVVIGCDGQLSSGWSTQLVVVNSAHNGQCSSRRSTQIATNNSLRLETA
ncbi:hypothetical protein F511_24450 [Dorcoceras hygrometricum]|uniref:Uncharacterized protein n=1 Tax=Dorcoceras hygrometricum TaxID=472368 RepID=A0A2Z7CUJ9_9LAMI|nr:hypothetical protein F511_24450 [Dorcoceras hygrometricum]